MAQLSDDVDALEKAAQAVETAIVDLQAEISNIPPGTDPALVTRLETVVSNLQAASAADPGPPPAPAGA